MSAAGAAAQRLLELLGGKWIAQALSTAAALGIPDALAQAPQTAPELAAALGCDADGLARLLAVLVGLEALEMLVLTKRGRERSKPELRRLFARARLRLVSTAALSGFSRLLVGVPA